MTLMVVSIFAQAMSLIAFLFYEIDIFLKLKIVSQYCLYLYTYLYITCWVILYVLHVRGIK